MRDLFLHLFKHLTDIYYEENRGYGGALRNIGIYYHFWVYIPVYYKFDFFIYYKGLGLAD